MALKNFFTIVQSYIPRDDQSDYEQHIIEKELSLTPPSPRHQVWANAPLALFPMPKSNPLSHSAHTLLHRYTTLFNALLRCSNAIHIQASHLPTSNSSLTHAFARYTLYFLTFLSSVRRAHDTFSRTLPSLTHLSHEHDDLDDTDMNEELELQTNTSIALAELQGYVKDMRDINEFDHLRLCWLLERAMALVHSWMSSQLRLLAGLKLCEEGEVSRVARRLWRDTMDVYDEDGDMSQLDLTLLLTGTHDITYPGTHFDITPVPSLLDLPLYAGPATLALAYMDARIWQFNPCDSWGHPRALPYGTSEKGAGLAGLWGRAVAVASLASVRRKSETIFDSKIEMVGAEKHEVKEVVTVT